MKISGTHMHKKIQDQEIMWNSVFFFFKYSKNSNFQIPSPKKVEENMNPTKY